MYLRFYNHQFFDNFLELINNLAQWLLINLNIDQQCTEFDCQVQIHVEMSYTVT